MSLSDGDIAFGGLEDYLEFIYARVGPKANSWRFQWKQLKNLRKLVKIWIPGVAKGDINEPFPELQSLTHLLLDSTNITFLAKDAFQRLPNLELLSLDHNAISKVTRSMLPQPAAKLRMIYLK